MFSKEDTTRAIVASFHDIFVNWNDALHHMRSHDVHCSCSDVPDARTGGAGRGGNVSSISYSDEASPFHHVELEATSRWTTGELDAHAGGSKEQSILQAPPLVAFGATLHHLRNLNRFLRP